MAQVRVPEAKVLAEWAWISSELLEEEVGFVRLARGEAALRLRIGELLDALFLRGGHHELGFSSFEAYVVERCQRSASWGRDSRRWAKRIRERGLVLLRRAIVSGEIEASMAGLLARYATRETEAELIARARTSTVRAMAAELGARPVEEDGADDEERAVRPKFRVTAREVAALGASRLLVEYLVGRHPSDETLATALLGEGVSTLQTLAERAGLHGAALATDAGARDAALEALRSSLGGASWSGGELPVPSPSSSAADHGEGVSDDGRAAPADLPGPGERTNVAAPDARTAVEGRDGGAEGAAVAARSEPKVLAEALELGVVVPATIAGIDEEIVSLCRELTRRLLKLAQIANSVLASCTWVVFGYSRVEEYLWERVGMSRSTLEHLRTFLHRARRYPAVLAALEAGEIGCEAAQLIGRVLGRRGYRELVEAWVARARVRTVKHLREEVRAVLLARSLDPELSRMPPSDEDLEEVAAFEREVQSGAIMRPHAAAAVNLPQMSVTLEVFDDTSAQQAATDDPDNMGAAEQSRAEMSDRRRISFRMSPDLYAHWRDVEAEFRAVVGEDHSFVGFLCAALWATWLPYLEARDEKWAAIHRRDRYRCTSPVCERHDVTLHHLRFRSQGGTDDPENLSSPCPFCHLEGIHRGRLRAEGPASSTTWVIGREPIMVVRGREKIVVR